MMETFVYIFLTQIEDFTILMILDIRMKPTGMSAMNSHFNRIPAGFRVEDVLGVNVSLSELSIESGQWLSGVNELKHFSLI